MFQGSIPALVTPFKDNELDEASFRRLIRYHVESETDGLLVAGCTGEAANLSIDEVRKLTEWAIEETEGHDMSLIVGTGSNSTAKTIERTKAVSDLAIDGILVITPYYNKPTAAGQIAHFDAVANESHVPVILYNVPGRTGLNMAPETIAKLAENKNITALKQANGDVDSVTQVRLLSDITILSGDDTLALPMMTAGASGVISVTANVHPLWVSKMCQSWRKGAVKTAMDYHFKLFRLSKIMFLETNPMSVKAALYIMGMIENELRLPLVSVKPESIALIREELTVCGLLEE